MPEGRGKKAKKARWQLTLGMKQVICGGLGLTWVMLIIFILGVMAGRGDIYRWFSSWGLITPDAPKIAQWSPPPDPTQAAAPANSPPAAAAPAAPTAPTSTPSTSAASPPPVKGSMAPGPAPAADSRTKKAPQKKGSQRDQEARDKELQRLRQEMAAKLKFQNSFDAKPPKTARTTPKKKEKAPAAAQKAQPQPVRVAQFRDLPGAKAKMAELQKKGEKVTLKKGKDKKGVFYDVVREAPAKTQPADALAQKTQKPSGNKPKKQAETRN